ncbi:AmmeMemoRadiSam system radical SAM enzyme [Candidatus Omnitrophota bacterium]
MLYEKSGSALQCKLCSHRCTIESSQLGICGVRQNLDGKLYSHVYAEAIAAQIDPIEKKPLFHFFPGSQSFSVATIGCNFTCGFCQNWQISQASKQQNDFKGTRLLPEEIVTQTIRKQCKSISYTYTEPTIFFEYAFDTAKSAKQQGLYNNFVTNGYMTKEALDTIAPYLDACNVDLKSFRNEFYRDICGARLQPVLDSIQHMKKLGIWVEVTTLIVPGDNDSEDELKDIAAFIASVGFEIPWHISKFHPDFQCGDKAPTPLKTLKRAEVIGKNAGLRYVYLGNVSGESEHTDCYNCGKSVIERISFNVENIHLEENNCAFCGAKIDGIFETSH